MKTIKLLTIIYILLLFSCNKEPATAFEYDNISQSSAKGNSKTKVLKGDKVQFYILNIDAKEYLWEFGDGTVSKELAPVHLFNVAGVFNVKLTATNGSKKKTISKSISIIGPTPLPPSTMSYNVGTSSINSLRVNVLGNTGALNFIGTETDSSKMNIIIPLPSAVGASYTQLNSSCAMSYTNAFNGFIYKNSFANSTFSINITTSTLNNIQGNFSAKLYRNSTNYVTLTNGLFNVYF